jgi:hypothetical protein
MLAVPVIAVDRIDHQFQRRVDNQTCLFGIEILHQLGRAIDVGEERRDSFALTVKESFGVSWQRDLDGFSGGWRYASCSFEIAVSSHPALYAEFRAGGFKTAYAGHVNQAWPHIGCGRPRQADSR